MTRAMKITSTVLILLCFTQLLGCTSLRTVDFEREKLLDQLEIGDHLVIHENSGRIVDMKLASIDGDTLRGGLTSDPLRPVAVNVADIEKVERENIDGVKTTLAVVGGGLALYYFAFALFFIAIIGLP